MGQTPANLLHTFFVVDIRDARSSHIRTHSIRSVRPSVVRAARAAAAAMCHKALFGEHDFRLKYENVAKRVQVGEMAD